MSNIDQREALALINANRQAEIRATETRAPFHSPEGLQHLTPEELQLIALFRVNDDRGQALLMQIAAIHSVRYPRRK